jgi:1-aminocyclopropane-1-carboxylate deaminase/D-cysteine desulfhydrase-like pyridoxal-dependent ACC family enzyme
MFSAGRVLQMCRLQLPPSLLPEDVELWVKRDDLSGMQLSGNKVRRDVK